MNPKEKAIELVNKFLSYSWISNELGYEVSSNTESAKQCALIAVDEIIKEIEEIVSLSNYWRGVKQEIKKL